MKFLLIENKYSLGEVSVLSLTSSSSALRIVDTDTDVFMGPALICEEFSNLI
jgi:hypothetical protein